MTQFFNHGFGWETLEQIQARKTKEDFSEEAEQEYSGETDNNFQLLSVKELKEKLTELGIEFNNGLKKNDLIELLEKTLKSKDDLNE